MKAQQVVLYHISVLAWEVLCRQDLQEQGAFEAKSLMRCLSPDHQRIRRLKIDYKSNNSDGLEKPGC